MALLDRIAEVNRRLLNRDYYRFYTNGVAVGYVDTQFVPDLNHELFCVKHTERRVDCHFEPNARQDFEVQIATFFKGYFDTNKVSGWRDELFPVKESFGHDELFLIERAALSYLGITGYGVHINGYTRRDDELLVWVAKRAANKSVSPGKLDQIVAGGLPHEISELDNVIKECEEEASIPSEIAQTAKSVAALTYYYDLPIGLRPDVAFCYDLYLPESFVPRVNDGEVESFKLMHIDDVLAIIADTQEFKFNSAVVVIDFAIRHGIITPQHPDYLSLCQGRYAQL